MYFPSALKKQDIWRHYLSASGRHDLRHRGAGGQVKGGGGRGDGGGGGHDRLGVRVSGNRRGHDDGGGGAHAQLYVDGRLGLRLRADEAQPVHTLHPVDPLGQGQPGALVLVPLKGNVIRCKNTVTTLRPPGKFMWGTRVSPARNTGL